MTVINADVISDSYPTSLVLSWSKLSIHFPLILLASMEGSVGFLFLASLGLIPGLKGKVSGFV